MKSYQPAKQIVSAGVLIGVLILAGCGQQQVTGGPSQGGPPEVSVVTVQEERVAAETACINLAYTRVTAPIAERIGKSNVTVGALVTAGQSAALATIQQLDPVYVDVTQSSADLLKLKRSMASGRLRHDDASQTKVKLLLEDGTPYPPEGALKFSDVTVDPGTGSVTLRTVFSNPKRILLPGMYVRAIVGEGVNERALLVPQQGVTRDQKGNPVAMVANGSDKVEQRTLKIDRAIGDKWLVSEGLKPGERLIVEGFQRIKPGDEVKALPFETKSESKAHPGKASHHRFRLRTSGPERPRSRKTDGSPQSTVGAGGPEPPPHCRAAQRPG